LQSLGIPKLCELNQKLFKKQFHELAKLNRASKEQFSKEIASIVWTHTLKKSTMNIPALVTESLEYIEVAYIHVALESKAHFKKIAEVIHRIPYPVVLMMTYHNELCISTALKRINQADVSKLTVEEYLYSGWIDLDAPSSEKNAFLESMQIKQLSFENFYAFYQDIAHRIVALRASVLGGTFSTEQTPQKKQILDKIQPLQEQIVSLKSSIKKESQFNAKVRLNMQVKSIENEINALKEAL
jgi:hypothetical protein